MKGLLILSNGCEDGEALFTTALLRRAGLDVDTVTFQHNKQIKTGYAQQVFADYVYKDIFIDDYEFLVIPGGKYVALDVEQDQDIKNLALNFKKRKKLIAAICAGPRFLGQAGLLEGVKFTSFPGTEKDMPKGIYLKDQKAVYDQGIITARSAGAIYEFTYEIVKQTLGEQHAIELLKSIYY